MFAERAQELTRREVLRSAGAAGAVLTVPGLLAACGSTRSSTAAPGDGVEGRGTDAQIASITWPLGAAPTTLDPATGLNGWGQIVMALGLEGLVERDKDLKLVPLLAESWSQPDALHYVYTIRSGVTFWDGSPMTIDDVVFSIARHRDPKAGSQLSSYFTNVKSVEQSGEREVTITMARPDPVFAGIPAATFVTPKAFSEKLGKKLGAPGPKVNTMGTGPYEITSFSTDDGVTAARRSSYWGDKPTVRAVTLKYLKDPNTRLLAVKSGDVDGVSDPDFPLEQSREFDRISGVNTEYKPGHLIICLGFNMEAEPWNDIHVRRAVAHAADREGYVRAFLAGRGDVATSVVSPVVWADVAEPDKVKDIYAKIPQYEFDLAKAKAELEQSAHAGGFSAEIKVPNAQAAFGKAMVSLAQTLGKIGIKLRVKEVTVEEWIGALYAHKNLGLSFFWYGDQIDPGVYPSTMFDSAKATANAFNLANFKNPTVDKLLAEDRSATDDSVRARAIGEMLRIAGEELPYLPLWWPRAAMALRERYVYEGLNSAGLGTGWTNRIRARA